MRFQLICDLSEEYAKECLRLFTRLRSQTVYRQFFPALTFADDEEYSPLQVADMLAYCRREEKIKRGAANCDVIVRRLLEIFGSGGPPESGAIEYPRGSGLGEGKLE